LELKVAVPLIIS